MPGQAARGGSPSRRISRIATSTSDPVSSRPSASAPGAYASPALRMDTKADAHRTTVTPAAASASGRARPVAGVEVPVVPGAVVGAAGRAWARGPEGFAMGAMLSP